MALHYKRYYAAALVVILAFLSTESFAQTVPPSAAPEHLEQRFNPPQTTPEVSPSVVAPVQTPQLPQTFLEQRFMLRQVVIEGMTVYPEHTFDNLFTAKLGQIITRSDALAMARVITNHYRNDGYILSQAVVFGQNFSDDALHDGILHIRVVEGFIDNVIIQSDRPQADRRHLIDAYAEKIKAQRPLNNTTLERYMLLINDLPGVHARAVIRPATNTFGAADLVIQVQNKPVDASVTSDNRGNKYLGPYQEQATLTENSWVGLDERTTVRGINTIPLSELHYIDIQHDELIGTEGTRLTLLADFARTDPGSTLAPLDLKGTLDDYSVTVTQPFLRSRAENFNGRITFDARNTQNDDLGDVLNDDRVRAFRLGGTYDTSDRYKGIDSVDASVSQGISFFGATPDGAGRSNINAPRDFTKFDANLSRLQNLPDGFSVLTAATGQVTNNPLLLSEQMTLGGVGFGQAYDTGEVSGDSGMAGKVELRYGQPVGQQWLDSYQLYSYYDLGSVYINEPAAGSANRYSLSSLGAGVRVNFTQNLYGYLEAALPLTRDVASTGSEDPRVFFSLTARY